MPTVARKEQDEKRRAEERRVAAMHAKGERAVHQFEEAVGVLMRSCAAHMAALPTEVQVALREVRAAKAHKDVVARETAEMYAELGRTFTGGER